MRNYADQNLIPQSQKLLPFGHFRFLRPAPRLLCSCPTFPVWQASPLMSGSVGKAVWSEAWTWPVAQLDSFTERGALCVWKSLQWWTCVVFAGSNGGQAAVLRCMNVFACGYVFPRYRALWLWPARMQTMLLACVRPRSSASMVVVTQLVIGFDSPSMSPRNHHYSHVLPNS